TVVNNAGVELPATGGIGTTLFIVFGSVLAVAAGVVIVTNKRAKKEEI
ncbi:MAG: LPXTG cell wall anchor domain-containing protein, partial [Clostridia bacterium]|nr:LPXTG cell wall anchor domain-containing protein [Clostridia bacterium]